MQRLTLVGRAGRAASILTLTLGTSLGSPGLSSAQAVPTCNGLTATIIGGPFADVLNGGPNDDVIVGLEGNDTINGNGGNDTICGGPGNDTINGNDGNDWLSGG